MMLWFNRRRNKQLKTSFIHICIRQNLIQITIRSDVLSKVLLPFIAALITGSAYLGEFLPESTPCPTESSSLRVSLY